MFAKMSGNFTISSLYHDENYKKARAVYLTFWLQAKSF